mmetsp:Transcript_19753/g.57664  ORF Transcript_19753/g.57664 Transcript_19753/m.57664 type:complete len:267 (-) Transcript_19753:886-1686(-)
MRALTRGERNRHPQLGLHCRHVAPAPVHEYRGAVGEQQQGRWAPRPSTGQTFVCPGPRSPSVPGSARQVRWQGGSRRSPGHPGPRPPRRERRTPVPLHRHGRSRGPRHRSQGIRRRSSACALPPPPQARTARAPPGAGRAPARPLRGGEPHPRQPPGRPGPRPGRCRTRPAAAGAQRTPARSEQRPRRVPAAGTAPACHRPRAPGGPGSLGARPGSPGPAGGRPAGSRGPCAPGQWSSCRRPPSGATGPGPRGASAARRSPVSRSA